MLNADHVPGMGPKATRFVNFFAIACRETCWRPTISLAVKAPSEHIDAQIAAAQALQRDGKLRKAENVYRAILRKHPSHATALHMLGLIARQNGKLDRATQLLRKATAAAPSNAAILVDLGNALKATNEFVEAIEYHRRAVALLPDTPGALSNLGSTLVASGDTEAGIECLEGALAMQPNNPELHYNLGNALLAADRFVDAEANLRKTGELSSGHSRALLNLGVALKEQGRTADAVGCFDRVLASDPENTEAVWNRGLARLMAGDFAAGWQDHEARRRLPGFAMPRLKGPAWEGDDLDGRTLLVHFEQGLGDTIQFCRYLPLTAERGTVIFLAQQRLVPILETLSDAPRIVGSDDPLPRYDCHAPLMSLPHLLQRSQPLTTANEAYLEADPARIADWMARLDTDAFKIGVVWQGNPENKVDRRRSLPFTELRPLSKIPNVRLYSLQQNDGADQLDHYDWAREIETFGSEFDRDGAFLDTAAVMKSLDLVISPDTSIAHVAGALGVPVWVLNAHIADWRWGLKGESTPWYPNMRLFRQPGPGDWTGTVAQVVEAIKAQT